MKLSMITSNASLRAFATRSARATSFLRSKSDARGSFHPLVSSPARVPIRRVTSNMTCQSSAGIFSAAGLPDASQAGLSSAISNIGWISFWSQFILSTISGVVLLFSTGVTAGATLQASPTDILTGIGVLTGLIAAFISWGLVRTGRLLAEGKNVKLQFVMAAVLTSTRLNLIGLGATILGMQASIGGLVAKTLGSAAGGMAYYNARMAPPPVAFDVFTVQSCCNTILAHYVGLVLAYWLLSILRTHIAKEEGA